MKLSNDNYYTPKWCYIVLEPFVWWKKVTYAIEPCCGDDRIGTWLRTKSKEVTSNESRNGGSNFLTRYNTFWYSLLLSNPPYSQAKEFVEHGFKFSKTCCWLLPLSFLGTQGRKKLFISHPLDALYVLTERPAFEGPSGKGKQTANSEYAWFIWDGNKIFNKHGIVHI